MIHAEDIWKIDFGSLKTTHFRRSYRSLIIPTVGDRINSPNPSSTRAHCGPKKDIVHFPDRANSRIVELARPCFAPAAPRFTVASAKLVVNNACSPLNRDNVMRERRSCAFGRVVEILLNKLQQSASSNGLGERLRCPGRDSENIAGCLLLIFHIPPCAKNSNNDATCNFLLNNGRPHSRSFRG